jgi:hypothetical protein
MNTIELAVSRRAVNSPFATEHGNMEPVLVGQCHACWRNQALVAPLRSVSALRPRESFE